MKDFVTHVDGGAGDSGTFDASEANNLMDEGKNLVTSSGQTLVDSDSEQSAKAVALYVARADYYTDSGTANAYVLTPQSPFKAPQAYSEGMRVRFTPLSANTGAATINVNGIGIKDLVGRDGAALSAGALLAGLTYQAAYDSSGSGAFRLADAAATETAQGSIELATQAEVNAGTDGKRAVTPATLSGRTATETRTGVIELATQAEVNAGTDTERAVTPATLEVRLATLADTSAQSLTGNGYRVFPGGMILQWLSVSHGNLSNEAIVPFTFPLAFGQVFRAFLSSSASASTGSGNSEGAYIENLTNSGGSVRSSWQSKSAGSFEIFAVGVI